MSEEAIVEDVDGMDTARVRQALRAANHVVREAHFQLNQALDRIKAQNKVVGRQGQTIHQLRGELAEVREMISKYERGEVRRLERQVQIFGEQIELDRQRLGDKDALIAALRERVAELEAANEPAPEPVELDQSETANV